MEIIVKKIIILFALLALLSACSIEDHPKIINLNSNWNLDYPDEDTVFASVVPNSIHTDLFKNGVIDDPFYRTNESDQQWIDKRDWIYKTNFQIEQELLDKQNIELVFEGLDTYADVYLNDSLILNANNMFVQWTVDCKQLLKPDNELKIILRSPINEGLKKLDEYGFALPASNDQSERGGLGDKRVSIFTRKAPYHYGWDWGPRLVTSGIWKPVYLRGWNSARIVDVHLSTSKVDLEYAELDVTIDIESSEDKQTVLKLLYDDSNELFDTTLYLAKGINTFRNTVSIKNPKLWWPNGLGEQQLYNFQASLINENVELDSRELKFGIRTIEVVQQKDSIGESFYFKVNDEPVFMKGANIIPSDIFLDRVKTEDYHKIVKSAVDANMNMLRVWGGGIYEKDNFYDLCDEYGILVWQDFMFACAMYPGNKEFLDNVRLEAIQNVVRLRNHPSIALWCGNNEIIDAWNRWGWKKEFAENADEIWKAYEDIFYDVLPSVVNEYDSTRFYWPSSASSAYNAPSELHSGDYHYWGVWHGKEPFEKFDESVGRFMSEYGFQSFPEFSTINKFTLPEDRDIESEVMKAHQRSGIGNLRIGEYTDLYYKTPKNFEMQLYVGQLVQAFGIEKAIYAHRRNKPFCMGTLYWQLNDCWPVASWSSTDYYRNWKALHYKVKNAFENILIAPHQINDSVNVFIISDLLKTIEGELLISIIDFEGKILLKQNKQIEVEANSSDEFLSIDIINDLEEFDNNKILLLSELYSGDEELASNIHYFVEPKELMLNKPDIMMTFNAPDEILLSSDKLAKNVYLVYDENENLHFSENFFDLLPGEEKLISLERNITDEEFVKIKLVSLFDSFITKEEISSKKF
jgi:beta-mannosidase